MSKACELQSVTEIVTGKENTLSQADMTKFWETLFQTWLWIIVSVALLETTIRVKLKKKTEQRDGDIKEWQHLTLE